MLSGISRRMATVNGDENAVPTDFKTSSSKSSTKTPKKGGWNKCAQMTHQVTWRLVKSTYFQIRLDVLN